MALPVLTTPKFELTLPSTKKKYKFRPFLAKEEKVLLIAMQSEEQSDIVNAIKDIIKSCVEGLDINNLPMFDLEYIFLKLREKSIGDTITFYARHVDGKNSDGVECDNTQEIKLDLNNVKVIFPEGHTSKIDLDGNVGVAMKYPSIELSEAFEKIDEEDPDMAFNMIIKSIDYIYDQENVYPVSDYTESDLNEFIDSMSHNQLEKIQGFFETMPKLSHTLTWKCSKCGKEETVVIEGLSNFFI